MAQKILLITPPFTQLNTPYPATAYLKGFLNTKNIISHQADLGIEAINKLFSTEGLRLLFEEVANNKAPLSPNSKRIVHLKQEYIKTIDPVMNFLKGQNSTLAHVICDGTYLPEAARFEQLDDLEWAFGTMGIQDKAKHLITLYLEDLSDLIIEAVDPHFGFSRYAERLGRSANSFDALHAELNKPDTYIDRLLLDLLQHKIDTIKPTVVALSVPFPGNLYSALKCGQWLKQYHPAIKLILGGGFANTELRSLSDARVFNYTDFITLDDGEAPLLYLLEHLDGTRPLTALKRTYTLQAAEVVYIDGATEPDCSQPEAGTPDYAGLPLNDYLSVVEVVNPMHRLWSDGRWNKLTLAHGCYWGKCSFCDGSLDYIKRYEPNKASTICDRLEQIITQTGQNGFHFVDEGAPPTLLKELSLEILRRGLTVIWWTNIRFEKSFTADLCRLMQEAGCIAVSGGLEVASDRLLKLINKGVTVEQVTRVADHFTQAGIMVHAYLMYGFPTQTVQETIDALEVVRQLFMHGVVQSGFWHQFALTAHSPVGLHPERFNIEITTKETGAFANNDLQFIDKSGAIHEVFSEGLRKSLFNYMHGICFDYRLDEWFDFKVPRTTLPPNYIEHFLSTQKEKITSPATRVVWLGYQPLMEIYTKKKKGKTTPMARLIFHNKANDLVLNVKESLGAWLCDILPDIMVTPNKKVTLAQLEESFNQHHLGDFSIFMTSHTLKQLRENGLLFL
ncbi:radical SAM protein [Marinilabiliaceae bacterium JC017]|nr:radical SAM protein [Marinilabiliaceae bacterium JC017]